MKKDYILIVAGIIPLLFSLFVLNFFLKDDRKDLFESAQRLESYPDEKGIQIDPTKFVKFSGIVLDSTPKIKGEYILAVREKFIKGKNGKRSEWLIEETYLQPIKVKINDLLFDVEVTVANDYLPCGDAVKISELEPKKSRILGIPSGVSVSAVGQIVTLRPLRIQTGHSLCTGTIENYEDYIHKKWLGYAFILLCISIPSLGLIYLGLFNARRDNGDLPRINTDEHG